MGMVYSKSPKGSREVNGRTNDLPEDLREVLKSCRGRFTIAERCGQVPEDEQQRLADALVALIEGGYLRESLENRPEDDDFPDDESDAADPSEATADDAASPGDAEPEEGVIVDDAAGKLRAGVARRRGERDENTSELVRQFDEEARRKAEEKAAREAEEQARREAEEAARRAAEEEARRQAEEQARREAEEAARLAAEEEAKRKAEEERQRAEEERRRKAAERKAAEEARERARLEQEERDRLAIQERLAKRRAQQRRVILPVVFGVLLPLLVAALFLQVYNFDGRRAEFEKAAAGILGVPVKAGSAKLWFAPGPQWRFGDVTIDTGEGRARIERVGLTTSWGGVFGSPSFSDVHLDAPTFSAAGLVKAVQGGVASPALAEGSLTINGLRLTDAAKELPPLGGSASYRDGQLVAAKVQGASEESGKLSIALARDNGLMLELGAGNLRWLLGPELPLGETRVKGRLAGNALQIDEWAATLYAGDLSGSGQLAWEGGWRFAGKFEAKRIEAERLARGWLKEGLVAGNATVLAVAPTSRELAAKAQLAGSASLERGVLVGVDLDKVLQGQSMGEETRFESLAAEFSLESGRIEVSNLRLSAPSLKAGGNLRIEADQVASGRLVAEADTRGPRNAVTLKVGGSRSAPAYQR